MELISAFTTIVSLIGQFRGERSSQKQTDFNEFLEWLLKTKNEEIKYLIEEKSQVAEGIRKLLNEQHSTLITKLEQLENALASYANRIEGFSDISNALSLESRLSDQAFDIIHWMEDVGASSFLEDSLTGETVFICINGGGKNFVPHDQRFIKDDLNTLLELGLLRHRYNKSGKNLYDYTRNAHALIRSTLKDK